VDWRGGGRSKPPIDCYTPAIDSDLLAAPLAPATDAGWGQLFAAAGEVGARCKELDTSGQLAHESTADAARDLDLVRGLLGEDKVSFLGFSYGTVLGPVYATLYPSRVRAMVLDSPTLAENPLDRWTRVAPAIDDSLDQFFAWCATSPRCAFGPATGRTATSLAAAYDALALQLDTSPLPAQPRALDGAGLRLATIELLYMPRFQWQVLGRGLALAASGDASALAPIASAQIAPTDGDRSVLASAFLAIITSDSPLPGGTAASDLQSFLAQLAASAPRAGGLGANSELPFYLGWPAKAANPLPVISAPSAPPALITATLHDPVCPYAFAADLQTALGNGSYVVTYQGAGHAQATVDTCLGSTAVGYLLDPTKAPAVASCPAAAF
jgi:pimeloyl-ACP methyl ester carboxylesterase